MCAPEVSLAGPRRDGPAGVRVHRTRYLPPTERTVHRGVPVTSPARTLLDLAATGRIGRLETAVGEAQARRLVTRRELDGLAASGRRGATALRAVLADTSGYTRQAAERLLKALIVRAELPRPDLNARVGGHDADAVWPLHRLIVEVDGYAAHGRRHAFERDRLIDQQRAAAGWLPLRVTWRQLNAEPEAVVARLAGALARSGWSDRP